MMHNILFSHLLKVINCKSVLPGMKYDHKENKLFETLKPPNIYTIKLLLSKFNHMPLE